MFPIRPDVVTGIQLTQMVGASYICPYCHAQSVTDNDTSIGWVTCPMRPYPYRWICLGCFEDIYSTCLAVDYMAHPYRDIVQSAAKLDGLDEKSYRQKCLQHQLDILDRTGYILMPHNPSRKYIESLITDLNE